MKEIAIIIGIYLLVASFVGMNLMKPEIDRLLKREGALYVSIYEHILYVLFWPFTILLISILRLIESIHSSEFDDIEER